MARMIDAEFLEQEISKWINCPGDGEYYCGYDNALTAVLDLIADAPTLTPPNEWASVEERLPEYNPGTEAKSYWVAKKDSAGNWQMKIAQYCDYGYAMTVDAETEITWRDWDFTKIANVTHWMPLPESPKEELKNATN